jgi:uncharacterized protein with von Willebrand factor type A (vWA) domain
MSFYWQCNSSAICSLLALDEALQLTNSVQWTNRPQVLVTLDELRMATQNETGKTTQQKIEDVKRLTALLLELSSSASLPTQISIVLEGHNISLNRKGNRYMSGNISGSQNTVNQLQQVANEAMNELSEKYREALQAAKVQISHQEELLEGFADALSAEELEAKRAQLNANRKALLKANNEELKKQEEQLRDFAKEMNLEVMKPVRLNRKKKLVFIRRS